jgi:hypothetical protein
MKGADCARLLLLAAIWGGVLILAGTVLVTRS